VDLPGAPNGFFIASDDPETEGMAKQIRKQKGGKWSRSSNPDLRMITIPAAARYRTKHGSHTVAADGACTGDHCSIPWERALEYRSMPEHSQSKSDRIMRVLVEAAEDLFLLSLCDKLLGTAQSHFSTMAGMLVHARTAAHDIAT
jgi:hypothetical protein